VGRMTIVSLGDQRGIALPMAMMTLFVLMGLTFAFVTLATTEPMIGRNHALSAQARALSESGLERALWAMNSSSVPTFTSGIGSAPYDGSTLLMLSNSTGGFTVRVTNNGSIANEKLVSAVGWAPNSTGQLRSGRKLNATLQTLPWTASVPGAALNVVGDLDIAGNADISSWTGSAGVVHCSEGTPISGSISTGTTATAGIAYQVRGPEDAVANEAEDMLQGPSQEITTKLTMEDLALLKAAAQANGTYYQGPTTFNAANPMPPQGGILFVDTLTGSDLQLSPPTPLTDMGSLTITATQTWNGFIIAMGNLTVSGTVNFTGGVYARNDFIFAGNGTIRGAATAENRMGTISAVDSSIGETGNSKIIYDCPAFQSGGNKVPKTWWVKLGTYHEVTGTSSY
jgi:hypothetical protein